MMLLVAVMMIEGSSRVVEVSTEIGMASITTSNVVKRDRNECNIKVEVEVEDRSRTV